jgi:hypothetical protein
MQTKERRWNLKSLYVFFSWIIDSVALIKSELTVKTRPKNKIYENHLVYWNHYENVMNNFCI